MAKFKQTIPVIVDATQWFKNGDHPGDCSFGTKFEEEGDIVRYFRTPDFKGTDLCPECANLYHHHGWLDTGGNGQKVCPGDWVITKPDGRMYTCKPALFDLLYERFDIERPVPPPNRFIKEGQQPK